MSEANLGLPLSSGTGTQGQSTFFEYTAGAVLGAVDYASTGINLDRTEVYSQEDSYSAFGLLDPTMIDVRGSAEIAAQFNEAERERHLKRLSSFITEFGKVQTASEITSLGGLLGGIFEGSFDDIGGDLLSGAIEFGGRILSDALSNIPVVGSLLGIFVGEDLTNEIGDSAERAAEYITYAMQIASEAASEAAQDVVEGNHIIMAAGHMRATAKSITLNSGSQTIVEGPLVNIAAQTLLSNARANVEASDVHKINTKHFLMTADDCMHLRGGIARLSAISGIRVSGGELVLTGGNTNVYGDDLHIQSGQLGDAISSGLSNLIPGLGSLSGNLSMAAMGTIAMGAVTAIAGSAGGTIAFDAPLILLNCGAAIAATVSLARPRSYQGLDQDYANPAAGGEGRVATSAVKVNEETPRGHELRKVSYSDKVPAGTIMYSKMDFSPNSVFS